MGFGSRTGDSIKEREYLFEINNFVVAHTSEDNPNYSLAQELEEEGLLELIKTDGPLIRTVITDVGKKYIKK